MTIIFRSCAFVIGSVTGIACSTLAGAASFNIDLIGAAAPSATYGAAALQSGYWNLVQNSPFALLDVDGNTTGVSLSFPGATWPGTFDHSGTSGDDELLMDDFMNWSPSGSMPFTVQDLPAGSYHFYSYSFAPNGNNSSVDIAGSPEGFQLLGGTWPSSHQLGVTYALHTVTLTQLSDVTINVGVWNAAWGGFNGLQIVQVPEPTTIRLLALTGLALARRRRTWARSGI